MHKHHIMPRHLGGDNSEDNTIKVPVKEHAEIHRCLWVYGGRWQDEIAWRTLSGQITSDEARRMAVSRAQTGVPKKKSAIEKSRKWLQENFSGEGNPMYGKRGYWAGKVGPNKGKKRPDQSERMSGKNNPRYKHGRFVKDSKI